MVSFVIDEALLRKLSPEARREILDLVHMRRIGWPRAPTASIGIPRATPRTP